MDLFLTGRLGHLPLPPCGTDRGPTDSPRAASERMSPTTIRPHSAGREAPGLDPWRALLRELAP